MPWGGAYNRIRPDATAFVHRQERFQLKHAATLQTGAHPKAAGGPRTWRSGEPHPWGSGRVPELRRPGSRMAGACYGPTSRPDAGQERYDPRNLPPERSMGSLR
jgi:hypothetical protein